MRDLTLIQVFSSLKVVSNFTYNKNEIFNSLVLNLMRTWFVAHDKLCFLFMLRCLGDECFLKILEMICTESVNSLRNLRDVSLEYLN